MLMLQALDADPLARRHGTMACRAATTPAVLRGLRGPGSCCGGTSVICRRELSHSRLHAHRTRMPAWLRRDTQGGRLCHMTASRFHWQHVMTQCDARLADAFRSSATTVECMILDTARVRLVASQR